MIVYKEVCLLVGLFGFFTQAQAFLHTSPVQIRIDPVPKVVCAGTALALGASISNVEGTAVVRITADSVTAEATGMGAASTTLFVNACDPAGMVAYFHFGEHGSFSSNIVVVGVATVEAVPVGPVCVPAPEPIKFRAFPTDAAGYDLCPPQWSGPSVRVDPQDPWRASALCEQGGYYYAIAALGQDPPCRVWETSSRIMACEVQLLQAYEQDYPARQALFPDVCMNAQPEYGRAKYRVKLLPDDTSGTVRIDEGSDIALSQTTVRNRDTFYVTAGQTTGNYQISLEHDSLPGCATEAEGVVFRFQLQGALTGVNEPSTKRGVGEFDAGTGSVSSSTPDDSAAGHGALLTRQFEANVTTLPATTFAGRVRTGMEIVHTLLPKATIYKNSSADQGTVAVSGSIGFVRVMLSSKGPHSVATATFNAQVQVDDSAPVDAGNFTYSSDDFTVPLLWYTKRFGGKPVVQSLRDVSRLFTVGAGVSGIPVYARIGLLCIRREARGVATVLEAEATSTLGIRSAEDQYEIVP